MPSLDKLMEGKVPGSVRVCAIGEFSEWWFRPWYKVDNYWHGDSNIEAHDSYNDSDKDWQIFTEPKKPVVRHGYAYKQNDGNWIQSLQYYTEEQAACFDGERWIKLEHTRQEFPE